MRTLRELVGSVVSARSGLRGRSSVLSRRTASGAALTLVAGVLVALAVSAEGYPISKVDLNDGSVWVTKNRDGLAGRLNSQVQELDLGVLTRSTDTDLFQEASDVEVVDTGSGDSRRVLLLDVPAGRTGDPVTVAKGYVVVAGRTTVVTLDVRGGRAWITSARRFDASALRGEPTVTGLGSGTTAVVARDGTAWILDRAGQQVGSWRLDAQGVAQHDADLGLGVEVGDDAAMTVVGDHPVVLDRSAGTIVRPGSSPVDVPEDAVLQLPQLAAQQGGDDVYVASPTGLFRAGLTGGDLEKVSSVEVEGDPAAPATMGGCVFAAWVDPSADQNFERDCPGTEPYRQHLAQLSGESELAFRMNREVLVLNDVAGGNSWMAQSELQVVNNWDDVDPRKKQEQQEVKRKKERDPEKNRPPTAKDDKDFGARPGSTVVLPVTVNDQDPDGDVLTITPGSVTSDSGDVVSSIVGNGTQLQVKVGSNTTDTVRLRYEVTDGHADNRPSQADVDLRIVGPDQDAKPARFEQRSDELTVARGKQASVNVLPTWYDPDGDPLILTEATSKGGDVSVRPDGTVTFTDSGTGSTRKTIDFELQGGDAVRQASIAVTVEPVAKAAPRTVADRFTGSAESAILLEPLENDTDPLGGTMSVSSVRPAPEGGSGLDVVVDHDEGTATVRADKAGSYYLEYVAENDSAAVSKPELIRVDVTGDRGSNAPPVAERDTATLASGGSVLVDPLTNDADPENDVLIVRGVKDVPDGVKVALVDQRFLRVQASRDLGTNAEFGYELSDGETTVEGTVAVDQVEREDNRPPVARPDQVTARAGTVVTVPVLDNDSDPEGDSLAVNGEDLFDVPKDLPVVATGKTLRVLVPDDGSSSVDFGYRVRDSDLAEASTEVTLNIKPDDPEGNDKPNPDPVEARTVSGKKVRIAVAGAGADPDGDPVSFASVTKAPTLGRIVRTGVDWIEYQAYDETSGTDDFSVQVEDQYGAAAALDVRVGVAPRASANQAPMAVDDELSVRPGRTIRYAVRQNDVDPDGDPFRVLPDLGIARGTDASLVGDQVQVEVPSLGGETERSAAVLYQVTDDVGGTSEATLTVRSSDQAPLHAPIATDDVADLEDVAGKSAGDTVDVDVLRNDGDIDGARSDLDLQALDGASEDDGRLTIELTKGNQVVPYRLVDADRQVAYGFVYVSGTETVPPVLDPDAVPVKVTAGQRKEIAVSDVVLVRQGREPRLVRTDQIAVDRGDGTTKPAKDDQTLIFRAPKSYHGPAAMTIEVTDGQDLNDPEGLTSQLTVPIDVKPAGNVAPTMQDTSVEVAAGGDERAVDLDRLADDANDDDLSFTVSGQGDGIDASVDGDELKIKAGKGVDIGSTKDLQVTVDDGSADPVESTVAVRVVDSTQPLMVLSTITRDGQAGKATQIDVEDAIVNDPYPTKDKKIVGTPKIQGEARAEVAREGTTITVTPAKGFTGTVPITYRLADGSGLDSREVTGRLAVTEADVPGAPGRPSAEPDGPDAVRVSWTAADDRGKPVTEYRVSWSGGQQTCETTQCTIDGLDAGREYAFRVEARNEVGWGEKSPASASVTPDEIPEAPAAPTVDSAVKDPARNARLKVSWSKPSDNGGSSLTSFEVQRSPGGAQSFSTGTTTSTFTGLTNGSAYRFRVRAVNKKGESPWSSWSGSEKAFTKPSAPTSVELTAVGTGGTDGAGRLEVTWGAGTDGGDPITGYEARLLGGGQGTTGPKKVSGAATSFDVENSKRGYTVEVRALNRAGESTWSRSGEAFAYDQASAPRNIKQVGDDYVAGGSLTRKVSFDAPSDDGGLDITRYRYTTSDGGRGEITGTSGDVTFTRFSDDALTVTLTPTATAPDGTSVDGQSGTGGSFRPFTDPGAPSGNGTSSGYRSVTIAWTAGEAKGRPITKTEIRGAKGGEHGLGGSETIATDQGGEQKCLQARSFAGGHWSAWTGDMCASAQDRKLEVYFTDSGPTGLCKANCKLVNFRIDGFRSSQTYRYTTNIEASDGTGSPSGSVGTDGQGRGDKNRAAVFNSQVYHDNFCITVDGVQGCKQS